ncbi:MAG: tRNA (adenosine(37)-N6)-threonylcarbamoyltransferase complex ATPase subunit type 1 TsaE [Rhizobiaceae bacterium]
MEPGRRAQSGELQLILADEAATERFGADIAMALLTGDCVCLSGDLGAGKTSLARALIRTRAEVEELEVPSPTYTICQTYDLPVPISHFDFYRLSSPEEVDELGLDEALQQGIAVIEWPERGSTHIPHDAIHITLAAHESGGRLASLVCEGPAGDRIQRSLQLRDFLDMVWRKDVQRRHFQGDASARRYETAQAGDEIRVLMDAPARPDGPPVRDGLPYSRIVHLAEDVLPFAGVAQLLASHGFAAPALHGVDLERGFILCEHLGEGKIVDTHGRPIQAAYMACMELLAQLHQQAWPRKTSVRDSLGKERSYTVPSFDVGAMTMEASLMVDWYAPRFGGHPTQTARQEFEDLWDELARLVAPSMPTLVLRDFHSPNLIWRPERVFPGNLGLIDFQDALVGPAAYDVASVAQDARIDIGHSLEEKLVEFYLEKRVAAGGIDQEIFSRDYAVLAAQRATKILGIFVRLDERDGKPAYLRHLPRMRDYLARSLRHPSLSRYRAWCEKHAGF